MKNLIHPKSFYFIRHGESQWNVEQKFAGGRVDTPLTDLGKSQALESLDIFETLWLKPTHIIHSPLSRAKDTALILNQNKKLPMIEMDRLREIDGGEWEGLDNKIAVQNWADGLTPLNGEDLKMFSQRLQAVFNEILLDDTYKMPFIAAHGRIINGLDHLYEIKPRTLQIKNCQILKFVPSKGVYPWGVYNCSIKNDQIHEELADWSQI